MRYHRRMRAESRRSERDRSWHVGLTTIVVAAATLRAVYLLGLRDTPLFAVLVGDGVQYDAWAQDIAHGHWLGSAVFYQTPLYPYLLALLYSTAGRDLMLLRGLQAALGVASCVMLAWAGRRFFDTRVGIGAGLLLAAYPPAIFSDGLVQKSSLDLFLATLLLALLAAFPERQRLRWLMAAGLALGAFMLNRENARVLYPVIAAWLWFGPVGVAPRRLVWVAAFTAGTAVLVLPVAVRNQVVGGEFLASTSQLGPNLYIGNHRGAGGAYEPLLPDRGNAGYEQQDARQLAERATGAALSPGQVSAYWVRRTVDDIRASPSAWVRLLGRKLLLTINRGEVADSESFEVYADYSTLLHGLSWFTFGILLPLATLGVWHRRREWRTLALLYAWELALAASVVLFYVLARYRYPLVPVAVLFAAAGVVAIPDLARRGRREWAPGLLAAAAVAIAANQAMMAGYDATYTNIGAQLLRDGRAADALPLLAKGVEAAPVYAPGHFYFGTALAATGNPVRARDQFAAALSLRRNYAEARLGLALALQDMGDDAGAVPYLEDASRASPGSAQAHERLARALMKTGRAEAAIPHYEAALEITPASVPLLCSLAQAQAGTGRLVEALANLEKALPLAQAAGARETVREIEEAIRQCRAHMPAPAQR
jgi:Tfp pilus assembly protein PilF